MGHRQPSAVPATCLNFPQVASSAPSLIPSPSFVLDGARGEQ